MNAFKINTTAVLLVLAAVAVGGVALQRWSLQPWRLRQDKITSLQAGIAEQRKQLDSIRAAKRHLDAVAAKSASTTPSRTRTKYHQWLFDVAKDAGVADIVIMPAAPMQVLFGHRLPFRIEARAGHRQLAAMMHRMSCSQGLHTITEVKLASTGDQDRHIAEIAFEAVHLPGGDTQHHLALDCGDESTPSFTFSGLLEPKQRTPEPRPEQQATPDRPATVLQLVATFLKDDRRYAWLLETHSKREFSVAEDEMLDVDANQLKITKVGTDHVLLKGNGWLRRVDLGDIAEFQLD